MPTAVTKRAVLAVLSAAIVGTFTATYPLFLGRSLVSPWNGPTASLYELPPYTYGAGEQVPEDVRGTDVGAMMWAILPYTMVQREAFAHGEWPLWNRYNSNGQPLWGQGQTFALDPAHLASLLIPDPALAMDVRFVAGRFVFALGSGLAVLTATGSGGAAAIIAVAAPFVGHFTSRFNHPAYFSLVYTPWMLLAFAALSRAVSLRECARSATLLALASGLQLVASTPKEGVIAFAVAFLTGLLALVLSPRPRTARLARLDAAAAAGVIAVLIGAPHWLIFLDTVSRAFTLSDQPGVVFAGPHQAASYVLGAAAAGQALTGGNALLTLSAACALASPRILLNRPLAAAAVLSTAAMLALAFGFVPAEWVTAMPLIGQIHHVWDTFPAATIPLLLVVSGFGLAAVLEATTPRAAIVQVLAITVAAVYVARLVPGAWSAFGARAALASVIGPMLMLLGLACVRSTSIRAPLLVLGLISGLLPGGLHFETGIADLDALLLQPRPRIRITTPSPAVAALQGRAATEPPSRVIGMEGVLFPGTQALFGLESTGGPDALRLNRAESVADLSGVKRTDWLWRFELFRDNALTARRFLDLANVRYLLARPPQIPAGSTVLDVPYGDDALRIVERPTAWPRAFFTPAVARHRGADGLVALMQRAEGGPFASVDELDREALDLVSDLPRAGEAVPASDYRLTPNSTSFTITAASPGLAVLTESYVERDFRVMLNGQEAPYIRVNHAFKGVRIPAAGDWQVRFEYRPARWALSWGLAAVGAAGLVGLSVLGWRREPTALAPDPGGISPIVSRA